MSMLAAIRPDDWNLPLFLHVLGAMVLVGALVLVATSLASRDLRLAFRALVFAAIPSWVVMRLSAQWVASKEGLDEPDVAPAWIDIGFATSEPTFLLMVMAAVCARLATRRGSSSLGTAALVLVGISLVACVVAIWAMSTKPT
jgi:hypothetical protein